MDFRIENHPEMRLTGLPLQTSTEAGRMFSEIPAFWSRTTGSPAFGMLERSIPAGSKLGVAGVVTGMQPNIPAFTYLIAIESPADRSGLPEGCVDVTAPAGTWAIFEAIGALPDGLQKTITRIYGEWFPESGYGHAGGPELEVYPPGDTTSDDYRCEMWIPVVKAANV
jgi:AraC family transcriptional regulator